jgi:hypothetical protein
MAFAVTGAARLLLFPPAGGVLTTRQASLNASDRSVAPPNRALDAALRPQAFPPKAGSLLPGLLTAPRTGPSPAGDDELMLDQLTNKHLQLSGHTPSWTKHKRAGPTGADARNRVPNRASLECCFARRVSRKGVSVLLPELVTRSASGARCPVAGRGGGIGRLQAVSPPCGCFRLFVVGVGGA